MCCICLYVLCVLRLKKSPQTLAELSESQTLLETLQSNLAKTEAQIPVIHEQFAILDKYEVPVEQDVGASFIPKQTEKAYVFVYVLYTRVMSNMPNKMSFILF